MVLQLNDRPKATGEGWSVDLATNLEPNYYEYCYCVVAMDCFSKWFKFIPLLEKCSMTSAEWLHRELIQKFQKSIWKALFVEMQF